MKQMTVKAVYSRWDPARPGCQPPEHTSFGGVGVNYIRAESANDVDEANQHAQVIGRPRRTSQTANTEYPHLGGTERDVVRLVLANRAGDDPLIEAPGIEYVVEDCRHQRRAADVESSDDLRHRVSDHHPAGHGPAVWRAPLGQGKARVG